METSKADIIKAAAIVLNSEKHLLIVRRKDTDIWISLGGKPDGTETLPEALRREVQEEVRMNVVGEPQLYFTSPIEPAAGKPHLTVQITSYLVNTSEEPQINPEDRVEEFHWLSKTEFESGKYNLGSVLQQFVVPKLIADGLME